MLGDRLKELREDRGMNQDQLANMLGITRSAVSSYETSTSMPSLEIAIKLANIFNVSLDYLTCRTKERYNLNLNDSANKEFLLEVLHLVNKYNIKYKK